MQEFIQRVMSQFGLDEDAAKSLTGGVLSIIKDEAGADANAMFAKVPGAEKLAESAEAGGGGGGLGGMLGKASSAFGGKAGTALELASTFKQSGLSLDKAGEFVPMLVTFLKEKAGSDVVGKIMNDVPALKKFLG